MQSSISGTRSCFIHPCSRQEYVQPRPIRRPGLHATDDSRSACALLSAAQERAGAATHGAWSMACGPRLRHAPGAMPEPVASQLARAKKLLAPSLHRQAASCLFMAWCQLLGPMLADFIIALEQGQLALDSKRKMLLMLLCAFIACKPPRQLATLLECEDRHSSRAIPCNHMLKIRMRPHACRIG
jgi:hypothetical protein